MVVGMCGTGKAKRAVRYVHGRTRLEVVDGRDWNEPMRERVRRWGSYCGQTMRGE